MLRLREEVARNPGDLWGRLPATRGRNRRLHPGRRRGSPSLACRRGREGRDGPPVNVDIPHVSQAGDVTCTMGNWQGTPTGYAYQCRWTARTSAPMPIPAVTAADVGHTATCIVGDQRSRLTAAPPSNVVVADIAR